MGRFGPSHAQPIPCPFRQPGRAFPLLSHFLFFIFFVVFLGSILAKGTIYLVQTCLPPKSSLVYLLIGPNFKAQAWSLPGRAQAVQPMNTLTRDG